MAVIRDVNLDTTSDNIAFIGTVAGLCLIVAVLGIKLRWFKHRMTFNELPTTSIPATESNGMEPQIIRATFKPSSEFDNYVEVIPPKVLPPVRIHKSTKNGISLPPRKRTAPEVPTLRISDTNATNEPNSEFEPFQGASSSEQVVDNLVVEIRRKSTPPPPLPASPPPNDHDHEERLLLALEADYPYTESETIKIKEVHHNNIETILPSPPPYQESDPLAHIHFKKFTKKKNSSTPLPTIQNVTSTVTSERVDNESPRIRKSSFDLSLPSSPRDNKLDNRNSFLNQVPTPTELPKLAFDFPFASTPNLNEKKLTHQSTLPSTAQSGRSLVNEPSKPINEKRSLLEYFGLRSRVENDTVKTKSEKKVEPIASKKETKVVPLESERVKEKGQSTVSVATIQKPKVKKIRVLKTDKKENVQKANAVKNERLVTVDIKSSENARELDRNDEPASQQTDWDVPIMENRMEIDYFHKVKKSKTNRVPIIVKSPKPEPKFEEKHPKNEVFRHEETFSAANGPLKEKKKKKIKSIPQDAGVSNVMRPVEISSHQTDKQNIPSKSSDAVPTPKPRVILKLDGFDDDNRETGMNQKPKKKVVLPVISSPSSPSDTEDSWNLVAKHRLNTRAITATAISVRQKSESDEPTSSTLLQTKQLEMLNKPKTMREMKREQEERHENVLNFGGIDDKESDTEA